MLDGVSEYFDELGSLLSFRDVHWCRVVEKLNKRGKGVEVPDHMVG